MFDSIIFRAQSRRGGERGASCARTQLPAFRRPSLHREADQARTAANHHQDKGKLREFRLTGRSNIVKTWPEISELPLKVSTK